METLHINTTIDYDGHLKIDVPTSLAKGDVEVLIVIEQKTKPVSKYDFSDLIGRLQWKGNALAAQKAIRNEW